MTRFDVAIVAILLVSILVGFYRGLVRELFSLLTLVLAVFVAIRFYSLPQTLLPDVEMVGFLLPGRDLQSVAMFVLLFFSVAIAGHFIGKSISATVRRSFVSMVDRFLGSMFGLLRGGAVVIVLVLLAGLTALPSEDRWRVSLLIPLFERSAQQVACYVPEGYRSPHYACVPL